MSEFNKKLKKAYENPENYRLIERLPEYHDLPHVFCEAKGQTKDLVVLDTETTGFDFNKDEVIQLAMIHITVDVDFGRVVSVNKTLNQLNEPLLAEVTENITDLTGITKESLIGKEFDKPAIIDFMGDDYDNTYVVAHNAKFDYKFCMKQLDFLDKFQWGCTQHDIRWGADMNIPSTKLEFINFCNGYFYDGHNALTDCYAVISALMNNNGSIDSLMNSFAEEKYILSAIGAPFNIKDQLKENGFRWNADNKVWYRSDLIREQVEDVLKLTIELYDPEMKAVKVVKQKGNRRFEA